MISVLMSLYNEKIEWIQKSIDSILNQTYKKFEFIIVVDNPNLNKNTYFYLLEISGKDKRIKLVWNEKNLGLAKSLNKGLKVASGEYIARMDADDISSPERLEKQLKFIRESEYDLVSANKINIDEDDNLISYDPCIKRNPNTILQYSNIIVHPLVLVKTEVIKKMGGYRDLKNSEDFDLWLRMIDAGYKLGILNEYLLEYRIRSTSASVERRLEQYIINKYVIKLMTERKKYGYDTFSLESQESYLKAANITDKKKRRFEIANREIERALMCLYDHKIVGLIFLSKGFVICPRYTLHKISNFYFSTIKKA